VRSNIVLALDFTKSSNRDIRLRIVEETVRVARDRQATISILLYGIRAYPLLELAEPDSEEIVRTAVSIPEISGPSEPFRPFREVIPLLRDHGVPPEDSVLVISWSAPRAPKVPLIYGATFAENSGLRWKIILERPSPPRWFGRWSKGYSDDYFIYYRKNTNLYRHISALLSQD